MMSTKKEEKAAFDKLCKAFPTDYVCLESVMRRYRSGTLEFLYSAFSDNTQCQHEFAESAMEAVDKRIAWKPPEKGGAENER